ncbi:SDR family NAD(P)-dependent oxidoreductase [Rhodococcus sp. T7]|uniref:SDR family NAD(P)-dependent oxidoreductase n=1 Tax=Rhodococcus sp. T7 TaxID=627444 RepID=UPI0013577B09|nr:SDR family NAD(P)-dependent oxidoreductase [Rhodococcus sp. T7]
MLDFDGRVAVVTGAGRGVGRAHAKTLAARGCRVVVNDLPGTGASGAASGPAHDVVNEIVAAGGTAVASEHSVTGGSARNIIADAIEQFGQLDILINNAGGTDHRAFEDHTPDSFRADVEPHLFGGVEVCRAAWPHLKQSGTGRIVNTISAGIFRQRLHRELLCGQGRIPRLLTCTRQ